MRKITALAVVLALLLMPALAAASTIGAGNMGSALSVAKVLRKSSLTEKSTGGKVLAQVPEGALVIQKLMPVKDAYAVQYGALRGFLPTDAVQAVNRRNTLAICGRATLLRKTMEPSSAAIMRIAEGQVVELEEPGWGYMRVRCGAFAGYVPGQYLLLTAKTSYRARVLPPPGQYNAALMDAFTGGERLAVLGWGETVNVLEMGLLRHKVRVQSGPEKGKEGYVPVRYLRPERME